MGISHDKRTNYHSEIDNHNFTPSICIQSYDYNTLITIRDFIVKNKHIACYYDFRKKRFPQLNKSGRLQISGYKNMKIIIDKIYPYSIAKKPQYDIFYKIYEVISNRKLIITKRWGRQKWTKENWLKIMKLVDSLNSLKKKKRGRIWYLFFIKKWKENRRAKS